VDEIDMGITHVLRGDDLCFADNIQRTLIQALGAIPPRYDSVPVVRQPNGQKLSKQNLAPALVESDARSQLQAALIHLFPEQTWDGTISAMLTRATEQWRRIHEL
jgi:glutamyl-Q tRNA(Asp) synthetase